MNRSLWRNDQALGMNREYLKNLYLQRLVYENYLDVFKESISKIVSLDIINEIISLVINDDNTALNDLLSLCIHHMESNVVFYEKFSRSNFHLLLFRRPLTFQTYEMLKRIYNMTDTRRVEIDLRHEEFFNKQFYNYVLYKEAYNDYQFDLELDIGGFGPTEMNLFKRILKRICVENRENEDLVRYITDLPIDKNVFLGIVMPEYEIDFYELEPEDIFLIYPSQVWNGNPMMFMKPFLCSLNGNDVCEVCGRRILTHEFDEINHEEYLNVVMDDVDELCYGISHWKKIRTARSLTILLKLLIKTSCVSYYAYLRYFDMNEEEEDVVVGYLSHISSTLRIDDVKVVLRMFPFIQHTEKIIFSYFVILFEGFSKYSKINPFIRDVIRNLVLRNKNEFMRIRTMIFEYYINMNQSGGERGFYDVFLPLSEFFSEENESFVKNNMFYIYPMIHSSSGSHSLDSSFIRSNNHFLMISLFLHGEEDKIDDMGYKNDELRSMGVDVIVPLLCNGYFRYNVLSRFFGDIKEYIRDNLPRFLFTLKKIYIEKPFEFNTCVFKVLKCMIDAICDDLRILSNYLFPFIEFFMERHEGCENDCKSMFIEYYGSFFGDTSGIGMSRIFPYMSLDRIIELSGDDKYLDVVEELLEVRGYFAQSVAVEKAVHLLKRIGMRRGDDFDEENFIRYLLNRFFKDIDFRSRMMSVYKRLQRVDCDILPLIGYVSQRYLNNNRLNNNRLSNDNDIYLSECVPESIARTMIEEYLFEIDPRKQDIHFFVIQETLRFIKEPFDDRMEGAVEQFRSTQYSYEHIPVFSKNRVYERTYKFKTFLVELYRYLLELAQLDGMNEYFDLLKYGEVFDIRFLEFNCLCLARILLNEHHEILDVVSNVVDDLYKGIDRRIPKFILKLNGFTERKYVNDMDILRISLFLRDHYNGIQVLERMIRKERNRSLFDLLQYCYYMIGDYDKVLGINSLFVRITSINLFFGFCVEKNFSAAARCIESRKSDTESRKSDDISTNTQDDVIYGESMMKGEMIPGFNLNGLLEEIIDDCSDDEIGRFMSDCKRIEEDFSEWKNLESKNEIFGHFIKDCELVSKSNDLLVSLDLIAGRRELSDNNKILVECHEYLVSGIRNMMNRRDDTSCDGIRSLYVNEDVDIHGMSSRECFLASIDVIPVKKDERVEYVDRRDSGSRIGRYGSLDEFERDLRLMKIRNHMKENDFNRCIEEIGSMLLRRDWSVLYELAELNVVQGKIGNAKANLKKMLNLFPERSVFHEKALIRYTELIDTKTAYESALSMLNDSGRLCLLGAKKFESTEPVKSMELYINSVMSDMKYSDESIPRIFHLFSEMNSNNDINKGLDLLKRLVSSSLSLLPPYYNQIVSRLSHMNLDVVEGISGVVFELMENYPHETFWRSLIMINSQTTDTRKRMEVIVSRLSFDNKVLLSNVKKISHQLTEISRSSGDLSMSKDFPELIRILPMDVRIPNTRTTIHGMNDEIKVFDSLQRPKRICFIGADGRNYYWICKNKDDLRKDSRFMDLNVIINNIFRKQNNGKYIRTYTVIPFSHESGIIEWIDGLTSLKMICTSYYARDGISISNAARRFISKGKIGMNEWNDVIRRFPPRFHLWFDDTFPQPFNWISARNNYTMTYGVMSIVGWFMGLGDRHADNILFDSNSGDTVHVDLNWIFGKGKESSIPERVPYRLTQNIVDAFGVVGLEGLYNNTLCTTLDLFLKNKNVLISNLLSFVYDPLLEWRKKSSTTPKMIIEELYNKLDDLDVSSKCEMLNEEAMDENNLCMMYIGWLPFI